MRFEVVLPPNSPVTATWPNRPLLLTAVWFAALAAGAGLAYLLHKHRPVVSSVRAMNEVTSFPVLGVVSAAFPTFERAQSRSHAVRFTTAVLCLVAAYACVLGLNWAGARLSTSAMHSMVAT